MLKIGHRGAKGYVAENTLASFEKALTLNVDAVELDVHLSSDKVVMVIHDDTVTRTTAKTGFVSEYTAFELNQMGVPSLENALDLIDRKCIVNIEIKEPKATQKVIRMIENYVSNQHWNYAQFQISSFNWEILEEVSRTNSAILTGVLTENSIEKALAFAKKNTCYSINPYFKLLNPENTQLIRENGFKIYPWTVNSEEDLIFVKSLEVDGIISDFPDSI
jgi:glycerophosphoryl diester phosphodiesterase